MNSLQPHRRAGAFTLVEMLVVIAIIGILAALLLPVLSRSQMRAKRIVCVNGLGQMGIAFHVFMHDHAGKFPMQVPMSDGGSQEFVQNGYAVGGDFYFSFRHFQVLSNEIVASRILICPADLRRPAANFDALKNDNVSYFIGVDADYNQPDSILAGDRNIANASWQIPTIVHGGTGNSLRWTKELHEFKGDVLFTDGHVEEWNNSRLAASPNQSGITADYFLPTVKPGQSQPAYGTAPNANRAPGNYGSMPGYNNSGAGTSPASPESHPNLANNMAFNDQSANGQARYEWIAMQNPSNGIRTISIVTNAPGITTAQDQTEKLSTFDKRVVDTLRPILEWSYMLLLLLLLLFLALELWRRTRQKKNREGRHRR
jgi:prepilin-type N-terminal cleavage/methylation domain-containing protein/prepilin-type processing-associated H-X9-DG protein